MKKKVLSLILSVMMLISCLQPSFASAEDVRPAVWDGTKATAFAGGTGKADDPYLIANGAQLALVNDYMGSNFRLISDIYLNDTTNWESWTAETGPANEWGMIGNWDNFFQGVFDGNGYTVYGVYLSSSEDYTALFSRTQNATIKNLSIKESVLCSSGSMCGLLVGEAMSDSKIINCHNSGNVITTGAHTAGLVGQSYQSSLLNCSNSGSVSNTNSTYTDGNDVLRIAGIVSSANNSVIENCTNSGAISSYGAQLGGVVGHAFTYTEIVNCINHGIVKGLSQEDCIGGIVGSLYDYAEITGCTNYGKIETAGYRVGGITGQIADGCKASKSKNYGEITAEFEAGGIVGKTFAGCIEFCENSGNVVASGCGGITSAIQTGIVRNCINRGDITGSGSQNIGGIASVLRPKSDGIFNCVNLGNITGGSSVGGICGNTDSGSKVKNCWNGGTVLAESEYSNPGAITGRDLGCKIVNCFNLENTCGETYLDQDTVTEISAETLKSDAFFKTLNDWVLEHQRVETGFAYWKADSDGFPVPFGEVPAYIPISGALTLHQPENGASTISHTSAMTETTVTVTVNPNAGYAPYQVWFCAEEDPDTRVYAKKTGACEYTFSMPYGDAEVFSSVVALPENRVWDGTKATAFAGGDGTEENPYLIGNASQLALIADYRNSSFRLISDIYLNDTTDWESWTAESGPKNLWTPPYQDGFGGTFDGDGHTIYGMYTDATKPYQGFLARIYQNGVKNLTIDKSKVFGTSYVGTIAAINYGTIENCVSKAVVIANGEYCGGLVGQSSSIIRNCINYGSVTSILAQHPQSPYREIPVGGIVGNNSDDALTENCENHGTVTGYKDIGGIAGFSCGTITKCTNYADVMSFDEELEAPENYVGGIAGSIGKNSTLSHCANYGTIFGRKIAGGICGIFGFGGQVGFAKISNCTNYGTVTVLDSNAGGIAGLINGGTNACLIEQCVNMPSATVHADVNFAGGITGYIRAYGVGDATIRDCYNMAAISSGICVGGIAGDVWGNSDGSIALVETCFSTGTVSGTRYFSGTVGRVGANSTGAIATVRNCYTLDNAPATVQTYGGPGTETVTNVKALTAAQMREPSNFAGFDFDTIWTYGPNGAHPILRSNKVSGSMGDVLAFSGYRNEGITVTADDGLENESIYVILASYEGDRMVECTLAELTAGESEVLTLSDWGETVKILALSDTYIPLCDYGVLN